MPRFLAFVALALLLSLVFLVIGALIAVAFPAPARAFGTSLFVWFFFVLFYDLLVMGVTFLLRERTANLLIFLSLFGNPVDLIRVAGLMLIGDASIFGAAGAALLKFVGGRVMGALALAGAMSLWIFVPLVIAIRKLRRQDL